MEHPLIKTNEFLLSQAMLGRDILRSGASVSSDEVWNSILFTGCTGFIGGFLLSELLENTMAKIYCLVRCDNERQGKERLVACLQEKGVWEEKYDPRIRIIKGDLNLPGLGLSDPARSRLAERIDVIFHLGASVNWASSYTREVQANVHSFIELLKLASTGKLKPIHYSSSIGTYASLHRSSSNPILENEVFHEPGSLFGGYCQSKWVCEKIIEQARMRNVPINIYRIGEVNGNSNTGLSDLKNFINLFMGFCMLTQKAPESFRKAKFNLVPVDYVAKAIFHISKNMVGNGKNFQFNSSQIFTLEELVDEMNRCGFCVNLVSDDEWEDALNEGSWLAKRMKTIFKKLKIGEDPQEVSLFEIGQSVFLRGHDTSNTDQALKGSKVTCGKIIDDGILHNYLNYILKNL